MKRKKNEDVERINFNLTKKSIHDIETEELEDGLLIKEVPVFKTGKHRDVDYTEKYIDNVLINQFETKDNVPVQADHSDSYKDTLGYVKNLVRRGAMLYADMHLLADNAISRWRKGLMKKWSVSLYLDGRGLREISAVAFPYVKEASILAENEAKTIEIDAEDLSKELDGRAGKIVYDEDTETYTIELDEITPASKSKGSKTDPTHDDNDNTVDDKENNDNMDEETNMEDMKKIEELAELKAKELVKEAGEREDKLTKELEQLKADKEKTDEEKGKLEGQLDVADVKETVAGLKDEGKVLPAEEETVTDFILTLKGEQRSKYIEMLKAAEPKVKLNENGEQESNKEGEETDEYAVDFNEMTSDEIEAVVAKYAKDKGIPEADARDIIYDKADVKKDEEKEQG